jgi:hypothetical protein
VGSLNCCHLHHPWKSFHGISTAFQFLLKSDNGHCTCNTKTYMPFKTIIIMNC